MDDMNTHDVWNLAERLFFQERWSLVFASHHINFDKLERNLLLVQDHSCALVAGRQIVAVEL